jgi:hypothetical protein
LEVDHVKGRDRRFIDVAVDEVLDVLAAIDAALADGQIDALEAQRILREARQAAIAVERANVAELVCAAMLREGGVNPHLRRRALELGLPLVELEPEPEPPAAQRLQEAA